MRNLLLILVLANVLYFLWGNFQSDQQLPPGVAIVDESELGPPLTIAENGDVAGLEGNEPDSGGGSSPDSGNRDETDSSARSTELAVALGRTCVTLGPFRQSEDADSAQSLYTSQGMKTARRMEKGQIFVGHWVQIKGIADRSAGNEAVATLHEGGIGEAYLVTTDDEGLKISLGVFGNSDGAERVEAMARSLGFAAEISPRTADGIYYFVDVALPPGRGAGAIIDRFGEEKVRLRELSSCPD